MTAVFAEEQPGLRTGKLNSRNLTVKSGTRALRIVLAWSDPPGPALVNNLNLIVTAPNGQKLVGNQRRNGPSTLDAANNVEVVHIDKAAAGTWRIDVVGSNIPRGPQDFALVAIGRL
jgi:serine protease AprX